MFDPYGFLRHRRRESSKEQVYTRIRHWHEYVRVMPDIRAARQANRCMDCGTPFCHSYCPVHNLIPDWNSLVCEQQWREAYLRLESTNNFPEVTGRLCPAPCEDSCTLKLSDDPVTIKNIELAIAERAWQRGWIHPQLPTRSRSERISIIGSGPAGLACAQQLARRGYQVTVFDKADRPGGLLRYGIPDFRLDKSILDRRIKQLSGETVRFQMGMHIGVQIPWQSLQRESDALILACGSEQPRTLAFTKNTPRGVYYAIEYLMQQNHRIAGDLIESEAEITAKGKDVVVIGGGDTGEDCVGTAIRQGAHSVTQVQYHSQPPLRDNVHKHWPKPMPVLKASDTGEEGCHHLWGWDSIGFETGNGRVTSLALQRLIWKRRADGKLEKHKISGVVRQLPAQLVLVAIGYAHPVHHGMLNQMRLERDARGNVLADDQHYKTSMPGVFSCGDMRRGQSLVVWAIREGRQCAHAVDKWLLGESELPRV